MYEPFVPPIWIPGKPSGGIGSSKYGLIVRKANGLMHNVIVGCIPTKNPLNTLHMVPYGTIYAT